VGLGVLLAMSIRGSFNPEPEVIKLGKWLGCSACGYVYKGEIGRRPGVCPKCGAKAVWPVMRCSRCGSIVVIDRHRFRAEGREPYCTHCGAPVTMLKPIPADADLQQPAGR